MTIDKEYFKRYYQNNKQKIIERQSELVNCPICLKQYRKGYMKRHLNSNLHLRNSQNQVLANDVIDVNMLMNTSFLEGIKMIINNPVLQEQLLQKHNI